MVGLHDRRQALTEPSFVARTAELAVLTRHVRRAAEGRGGLVLLEAESGGGKSRLLEELAQQSQPDAWILRGQGVEEAARRPFQLLEGLVAGIVDACRQRPGLAERLRAAVGDRADAVVAALPALGPVLGGEGSANLGPEAYGETRSIKALGALLDALPSAARRDHTDAPAVVVLLDDCQWADGPTLRLLADWQESAGAAKTAPGSWWSPPSAPRRCRLTTSCARSTAWPTSPCPRWRRPACAAWPSRWRARSPRTPSGRWPPCRRAARSWPRPSSGGWSRAAPSSRPDGPGAGGWVVDDERLADVQTSRQAAIFLTRRLELLAPATVELLSVGAVLGKEFDLHLAAELCRQDPAEAAAGLAEASRRSIVWVDEAAGRARLLHDKLREALLSRLDPAHRRRLHLRAAERIEATAPDRVFELAYHFDAAGDGQRALPYAIQAAERARAQYSLDVAATHYRMALAACTEPGQDGTRAAVAEGLGDVLTLQGSYEEATAHLETAMALAETDYTRAVLGGKLGDVAFRRGDQRLAREHLERAVRQLNRRLPRRSPALVVALLVEVVVQVAHTLLPRLFVGRRSREGADREFLAIRLYSRLAYVYWFSAGKIPCAWVHLREMNLAERYPPSPELAQAYSEHAPVMTMAPWFSRGIAYARRSLAIRRDLGDLWGQGQSLNFYGVVLYAASRYRESIEQCREAIRLLDQTGDRWEANTASWHVAFAHYRLGELAEAQAVAGRRLRRRQRHRRRHRGRGEPERVVPGVGRTGARGAGAGPAGRAQRRRPHRGRGPRGRGRAPSRPGGLATGRWRCWRTRPPSSGGPGCARSTWRRCCRGWPPPSAARPRPRRPTRPPCAGPGCGGRRGRPGGAGGWPGSTRTTRPTPCGNGGWWRRSRATTGGPAGTSTGAWPPPRPRAPATSSPSPASPWPALTARPTPARWRRRRPPSRPSCPRRSSTATPRRRPDRRPPPPPCPWPTGSRRSSTWAATSPRPLPRTRSSPPCGRRRPPCSGSSGSSSSTSTTTWTRAAAGASTDGAAPSSAGPSPPDDRSCSPTAAAADPADSVVLSGLRSALCAPIFSEGRPVACLYVTHSQVADLFGEDEIQLIEFVAVLAGAALEHVAGTEARFRSLAQNSSDVITIVDRDLEHRLPELGRDQGVRPPARGAGPAAAGGVDPPAGRRPRSSPPSTGLVEDGQESCLVECRLRRRDGSWCDVETAITNLVDDPSVDGVVLNSRDVSDRKRAERELRVTLGREQDMRERLQELDKVKTDFLSSVSHELRTPLTSILGYLEMLAEGAAGARRPDPARHPRHRRPQRPAAAHPHRGAADHVPGGVGDVPAVDGSGGPGAAGGERAPGRPARAGRPRPRGHRSTSPPTSRPSRATAASSTGC